MHSNFLLSHLGQLDHNLIIYYHTPFYPFHLYWQPLPERSLSFMTHTTPQYISSLVKHTSVPTSSPSSNSLSSSNNSYIPLMPSCVSSSSYSSELSSQFLVPFIGNHSQCSNPLELLLDPNNNTQLIVELSPLDLSSLNSHAMII